MVEDGQVQELQSILGCTYEQAYSALHDAQGNMEWAMNRILDGPASPAPPTIVAYPGAEFDGASQLYRIPINAVPGRTRC